MSPSQAAALALLRDIAAAPPSAAPGPVLFAAATPEQLRAMQRRRQQLAAAELWTAAVRRLLKAGRLPDAVYLKAQADLDDIMARLYACNSESAN